jgi:16S rRNA (guanine966-N2)-methyltransferase
MLRIAAGEFKGLRLSTPRGVRATEGKVRQALFNIVGSAIRGARVLDGYAGSGAIGIEALSRGAAFAAFIESDTEAILCLRENLGRLGAAVARDAVRIVHLEMARALRHLQKDEAPFDLLVFDPPYRSDEAKKALNGVVDYAMLAPAGLVVVEHDRRTELALSIGPLQQRTRHRYGDTVLSLYQAVA